MEKPTTPDNSAAIERAVIAAFEAGVCREQLENFFRAGVVLQPRQYAASAAARAADLDDGPTEIGYGGARGGGKSHWLLAQMGADDCQRFPGLKCLLLRKVGSAIREALQDLRQKTLRNIPHAFNESRGTLTFPNGSQIILGHFKDEKDIDKYLGLEYDVIGVEEATTLSESKYRMIRTCNRTSKPGWRPRIYLTTNPGGLGHAWFKRVIVEPFRKGTEQFTRFISATVRDNAFVNKEYRRTLETLTGWQRRAWLDGDFDIAAGQFFTTFRRDIHVVGGPTASIEVPDELPTHWRVWLALDYGFTHYTVVYLIAEDGDGNLYIWDEHAARRTLIPRHCDAIRAMLARHNVRVERLTTFVAGHDVFSKRDEGETIADKYAKEGFPLLPAVIDRINGAAEILARFGDVEAAIDEESFEPSLLIHERCARLIECIPTLQHDANRPEDVLKIDCDEEGAGGDDCFIAGTLIETAEGLRRIEHLVVGDMLLTRGGYQSIKAVWNSRRNARVLTATFSDGTTLTATPNHRVWIEEKGWKCMDALRYGDILLPSWKNQHRKPKSLFLTASHSDVIQTQNTPITASTSRLMASTLSRVWGTYTLRFGSQCTAPFLRDAISIIETAIRSITPLTIWNASVPLSITKDTFPMDGCVPLSHLQKQEKSFLSALLIGTVPMKGEHGTASMVSELRQAFSLLAAFANSADLISKQNSLPAPSFVPISAKQSGDAMPDWTISKNLAKDAASLSLQISTSAFAFVPDNVQVPRLVGLVESGRADTYAIHVDEHHEYYANGVLVKNCYDAARYGIMEARRPAPKFDHITEIYEPVRISEF